MKWFYLLLAIVSEVIASSALRASEGFTRPGPTFVLLTGYAVSFFFLSLTLKSIPMGIAYAIWSGVGICLIAGIGWVMFGQRLDPPAVLGMGLIIAGVVVLQLFSKAVHH